MYKLDFTQNLASSNKELSGKSRHKESKQINFEDNKSRQFKQNDSKHLNAIKPYVVKQRKNSKRQISVGNSNEIARSKSKKLESSNRKIEQSTSIIYSENFIPNNSSQSVNSRQINQIYQELITLKTQYKSLKTSYNCLIREKQEVTTREYSQKQNYQKQKQMLVEEMHKIKKINTFLESEIQRIKRECFKILESQKFKNKKQQETIQEKQLMISFLRNQNQNLKKGKDLNLSQQENIQKIFFLQNSAPIFSYQSYARLSANSSTLNNVLIEERDLQKVPKQKKVSMRHKKSQFQQDSLSFSRDRSKQFDSVHSLLSNNNDQTILTFTKKDIVVLDESMSLNSSNKSHSNQRQMLKQDCLTFQNRKQQGKQIISFQNLKSKKMLYKSQSRVDSKKIKNSRQHTKRLQIMTDQFKGGATQKQEQENSCQTKKKFSKSKVKNSKKNSKNQGLHCSLINQVLHGSFIKKDTQVKSSNAKKK